MSTDMVLQDGRPPQPEADLGTLARHESGNSSKSETEIHEQVVRVGTETTMVTNTTAQRQLSGSFRSQFAAALQSHFSHCVDTAETNVPESPYSIKRTGSARFRGVTKHKRTQRYEAHIWECKKQIYLGGFDSELLAAKSHDIMALRCKGIGCDILNFAAEEYEELIPYLDRLSREDIITSLRNYSKAQTALRIGVPVSAHANSPPRTKPAGVQKGGSMPRHRSPCASLPPRRLSISTSFRRQASFEMSDSDLEPGDKGVRFPVEHGHGLRRGSQRARRQGPCPGALQPGIGSPRSPLFPDSLHSIQRDISAFDSIDLNAVLLHLSDEPSLTYSASDASYLFEQVPMDGTHTALEHLSGAILYQDMSPPASPVSLDTDVHGGMEGMESMDMEYPLFFSPFAMVTFPGVDF